MLLKFHIQLKSFTFSRTDGVGDFTLAIPSIFPLDRICCEVSLVLGHLHSLHELEIHAIEQSLGEHLI